MPGTRPGMTMNMLIEPAMQLAPRKLLHAAPELVGLGKTLRRQAAGVGAGAAPFGELFHRGGEFAARGILPGESLPGIECRDIGQSAIAVLLQANAATARHLRHLI